MPDSSPMVTPAQRKWLPWLTAVGFFMQTLDGTILNTALPSMAEEAKDLTEDDAPVFSRSAGPITRVRSAASVRK